MTNRAMLAAVVLLLCGHLTETGSLFRGLGQSSGAAAAENLAFNAAIDSITADDLRRHVGALADDSFEGREAGTRGGHAAGMYLSQQFERHKLRPGGANGTYFQPFGNSCRNVIGVYEGSDPRLKQQYVLLCAHYDHVGFGNRATSNGPIGYIHNGADDNASGVAALLETIEALGKLPHVLKRSIVFALWDSEEQGLYGSKHWVRNATVPFDQVVISINLDMIGKLRGERLEVMGTRTSAGLRRLMSEQNAGVDLLLDFQWDMNADSDHYTFFAASLPSLMLHTGLHDDYHRPSDDAHKLNYEGIRRVSHYVLRTAIALADEPERRSFRGQSREESSATQRLREQPAAASPARFGVRWAATHSKSSAANIIASSETAVEQPTNDSPGVVLTEVIADSPAARGGLRAGDRLLKFAGHDLVDASRLPGMVLAAVNPVDVVLERSGRKVSQQVALAGAPVRIGIGWRADDAEPRSVAITRVTPGSPAEQAGLRVNERIYQVNGRDFVDLAGFEKLILARDSELELLVEANGRLRSVRVTPLELLNGEDE